MKTADFRPGAKSQRARVENLSYLFVKRAGGPTFYEGRARARARARALSIGEILPSSMIVSPNEIANSLNRHVKVRPKKRPP